MCDGEKMEPKEIGLKANLGLIGLDMLFKPYEQVLVRKMWEGGIEPTGSGALYRHVNETLPPKSGKGTDQEKEAISRASVIFAANRFVDAGIWNYKTATGKGGHHRRYYAIMTEEQMYAALLKTAIKRFGGQPLTPKDIHDLAAQTVYNNPPSDYVRYLYEKALNILDPDWEETYDSLEL
jgi:hypothetical protein